MKYLKELVPGSVARGVSSLTKRSDAQIADEITMTLLRVINKIQMGRRKSRRYGNAGELSLIEAEMCQLISRDCLKW